MRPKTSSSPDSIQFSRLVVLRRASVLTVDHADRLRHDTDVLSEGGRIAALGPRLEAASYAREIDAPHHVLMPGPVNGHVHSPANFLKGALDGAPLEMFRLYEVPPLAAKRGSSRLYRLRRTLAETRRQANRLAPAIGRCTGRPFAAPSA
jgi:cytosine/adenosine deaminase-related metal-dependent hydrolase